MVELPQLYPELRYKVQARWKEFNGIGGPPTTVFHYTCTAATRSILRTRELWASDVLHMKDKEELQHGCELFCERLHLCNCDLTRDWASLFNVEDLEQKLAGQVYVVCFCANGDSEILWKDYGDFGQGYALGFASSRLLENTQAKGVHVLARVLYDKKVICDFLDNIIQDCIDVAETTSVPVADREKVRVRVGNFLLQSLLRIKHREFHEEQEWRLIVTTAPTNATSLPNGPMVFKYPLDHSISTIKTHSHGDESERVKLHKLLADLELANEISIEASCV